MKNFRNFQIEDAKYEILKSFVLHRKERYHNEDISNAIKQQIVTCLLHIHMAIIIGNYNLWNCFRDAAGWASLIL